MSEIERLQQLAGIYQTTPVEEAAEGNQVLKTSIGHTDHERKHIQQQMYKIGKYAIEIHKMMGELPENADLPAWWTDKITKSASYISSAKHYLEEEMYAPVTDDSKEDMILNNDY